MKAFLRMTAIALLALAIALPFAFTSAAAEPVLFIKDGGTGDGSSPSKPLSLEDYSEFYKDDNYHYGSVLFQAAHRLQYSGGTIVLVGEVRLDKTKTKGNHATFEDFFMPDHPDSTITITSKYNGVDYTSKGARLILQSPTEFICGGDTVFRDIKICTEGYTASDGSVKKASSRMICANGYDLTMDTGIVCKTITTGGAEQDPPDISFYPNIVGGHRYADCIRREGNNTVTLKSGTYSNVLASTYMGGAGSTSSNNYGAMVGNVTIVLDGNATVRGYICGGGPTFNNGGIHYGDVTVVLKGGKLVGNVYATNGGGFGTDNCTFTLKVIGGTISSTLFSGTSRVQGGTDGSLNAGNSNRNRHLPAKAILDLSECTNASLISTVASKAKNFTETRLPVLSTSTVSSVTMPKRTAYYTGDAFDADGLSFKLTTSGRSATVTYSPDDSNFRFEPSLDTPMNMDTKKVTIYYGSKKVGEQAVTVTPRMPIRILGAQIRTNDEKQTLRFLGQVGEDLTNIDLQVTGYGLVIQPTEYFSEKSLDLPGATVIDGTKTVLTPTSLGGSIFAGDITNIPVEEYDLPFSAFAYLTYTHNGTEYTVYSDTIERSVRGVAEAACASDSLEPADKKAKLNAVLTAEKSTVDEELIAEKVAQMQKNFKDMADVEWTPSQTIDLADSEEFVGALIYKAGTTYYGIPYIAAGTNGNISLAQWLSICPDGGTYTGSGITWNTMPGNQCSSSVVRALQTVTNRHSYFNGYSIRYSLPKDTHPYYSAPGGYPVGDHTLTTQQIIREFGDTVEERAKIVYNAYANAKSGDFLVSDWVSSSTGDVLGHIMIIHGVSVKYKDDGSIDPNKSVLYVSQQASNLRKTKTTWGINEPHSFAAFYNGKNADCNYLPIRLKAFEDGYFATPFMTVRERNTPDNVAYGLLGKIESNYQINLVRVTITDTAGKVVKEFSDYPFTTMYYDLRMLDKTNTLASLASGSYRYELTVGYGDKVETVLSFDFEK